MNNQTASPAYWINEVQKLEIRVDELEAVIIETLDKNRHLADGDTCTLLKLKQTVNWE